ncbi:peptidase inhibitor family I36 protein [Allokutzneria sp. NRRL B-24872]|uniref:peptidase inhibitor family I36 protein n=1 Tax=Allokutzneria sp. NRRL B-24872 TaxID=1137961 RepID=UPI001AEF7CAD|nr:peptidase inhibitor family I36 protein [Allokutzneria sp. NRRL B-24872]
MSRAPEGDEPAAVFARQLWELKQHAGDPSYDAMRQDHGALASKSALSAAARGAQLPSWDTTWEFVRPLAVGVLGQDEHRVHAQWRQRWDQANAQVLAKAEPPAEPPPAPARTRRRGWWALGAVAALGLLPVVVLWPRTAGPAPTTIAEPCEAGSLCLYRNIGFDDMNFRTQRQNFCWQLAIYHLQDAVFSYDNNLPVAAHFYDSAKKNVRSIRAGDSSQDSSSLPGAHWFCTGSARP